MTLRIVTDALVMDEQSRTSAIDRRNHGITQVRVLSAVAGLGAVVGTGALAIGLMSSAAAATDSSAATAATSTWSWEN